jgi:Secretion system C-terminal sorting domain
MKRLLIISFVSILIAGLAVADYEILWDSFGDSPLQTWPEIRAAANGDFVYSNVREDGQFEIVRLDPDGNEEDRFMFGSDVYSGVAIPAFGGGYIGGITIQVTPQLRSAILFRADDAGNILWTNTLGEQYGFDDIIEAPDGNWVIQTRPSHDHYDPIYDDDIVICSPDGEILHEYWIPEEPYWTRRIYQTKMNQDGTFRSYGEISQAGMWLHYLHLDFDLNGTFQPNEDNGRNLVIRFCLTPQSRGAVLMYLDDRGGYTYQTRARKITETGLKWDRNLEPGTTIPHFWDICPIRDGGYMTVGNHGYYCVVKALYETSGHILDQYSLGVEHYRIERIILTLDGSFVLMGRDHSNNNEPIILRVRINDTFIPVNINIGIKNGPVHLPAEGGGVAFRTTIANDRDESLAVTAKLRLHYGDSETGYDIRVNSHPLLLEPNEPIWYDEGLLNIPTEYPAGRYTLIASLHDVNNDNLHSSQIVFWKDEGPVMLASSAKISGNFFSEFSSESAINRQLSVAAKTIPTDFSLEAPYPNPFNAETRFSITLPQPSELSVVVYDIQGRVVATLASNETRAAGTHNFTLNGSDLASGLYFVKATVPSQMNEIRKLVLVK